MRFEPHWNRLFQATRTNLWNHRPRGRFEDLRPRGQGRYYGDYLIDATVDRNPELPTDYEVSMQFDPKGARIFEKLTEKSVGRLMAIVLDDVQLSASNQTKIPGGRARITLGGGYGNPNAKLAEATDLVQVLKAGALPAPSKFARSVK